MRAIFLYFPVLMSLLFSSAKFALYYFFIWCFWWFYSNLPDFVNKVRLVSFLKLLKKIFQTCFSLFDFLSSKLQITKLMLTALVDSFSAPVLHELTLHFFVLISYAGLSSLQKLETPFSNQCDLRQIYHSLTLNRKTLLYHAHSLLRLSINQSTVTAL